MANFVLVHGAWHGGWCWKRVAELLRTKHHSVFTPTLTGLCERSHLLNPDIDLDTHILDIVNEIKWKDLRDVILVGHSYGGMVVSGVVEKMEKSIAALVMADAFFPADGQSSCDIDPMKPQILKARDEGVTALPPLPAAMLGVNEKDRAWVDAKCTPQPIQCFLQPISLTGARERIGKKAFIRAKDFPYAGFDAGMSAARIREWDIHEVPGGHDVMIDAPKQLAEILDRLA
ncbi:alpha/beta fold hydrolase [Bradyrhizobium sp. URHD0069]|jgi:pimeloyl-ACP methyl ester carboxylesterase|uniref:alpha/beta fold hydrolase n=1 Tax=Bradyrhizobium sp. URHD0069 TaxID=1380355 RepID=UPI0004970F12|nr:alpha/beta hydrolase [Bradyrhizobium sp. URHD0069]